MYHDRLVVLVQNMQLTLVFPAEDGKGEQTSFCVVVDFCVLCCLHVFCVCAHKYNINR